MAREAKVLITSSNNIGAGIKSAVKDLTSLESNAVRIGKSIQSAFSVIAITAAAKQVVDFGVESVKAFGEAERAMAQLKTALGGNDAAFSRMNDFIAQMGTKTLASKDEVEALVAELASLGKSETDIKKLTEASIALSNVTGQSLDSAFKALNGTYVGTTKELKKLLPEIGNLTAEQLAAGGAVDMLNDKFGDISASMGEGILQSTKNLTDAWGDLKEEIGAGWAEAFKPMTDAATAAVNLIVSEMERARSAKKKVTDIVGLSGLVSSGDVAGATTMAQGMDKATLGDAYMQARDANPLATAKQQAALDAIRTILSTMSAPGYKPVVTVSPDTPLVITPTGSLDDAAWLRFVDENRVGWRELDSGIDDVVAELLNPPASTASTSTSSPVSTAFEMLGGTSMGDTGVAAFSSSNPLAGLMGSIDPLIGMFLDMATSLSSVMALVNWAGTIMSGVMEVIGPLIDEALTPLVGILKIAGHTIGAVLTPVIKFLTPIITELAEAWVWWYNKAMVPFYNWIIDFQVMFYNGWTSIINGLMEFIDGIPGIDAGWRMTKMDAASMHVSEISYADLVAAGSAEVAKGNGGSASYSGSQPITFNFYNQGNVVGSGGLEELAAILQGILTRNARYA